MQKESNKQEQILDAAMICLARYGIIKVTLDDIADVLGMKKASLYYYYKNKEAIFIDALEREALHVQQETRKKFKEEQSAAEKIYLLIKTILKHFRERAQMLELNAQAMVDNHLIIQKIHHHVREKNIDFLASIIQEGIDKGEFRSCDPLMVADVLRAVMDLRRVEILKIASASRVSEKDFKKLEHDSFFILDLLINGINLKS